MSEVDMPETVYVWPDAEGNPMSNDALEALKELREHIDACEVAVPSTDALLGRIEQALTVMPLETPNYILDFAGLGFHNEST